MNRHRQPAFVLTISHIIQCLDELTVNHAHQVVEGFVRVRQAAEQRHLFLSHFFQAKIIRISEPCYLGQVEGREPNTHTDQDGFQGLAGTHLEDVVLLDSNAFRVAHLESLEQNIQRRFEVFVFFSDFGSRQHFHDHGKVLLVLRCFMDEVQNESLQQSRFGLSPEWVCALGAGRSGTLYEGLNQPQHVLVISHIGQRIIAERCVRAEQVEHPHLISSCNEGISGFAQDLGLWI